MVLVEPLNLKYILVNILAGSPEVFTFLLFMGISVGAAIFKMPDKVFLLMIALAAILLQSWIGGGIYLLVLLIGGIAVFYTISKIVKT